MAAVIVFLLASSCKQSTETNSDRGKHTMIDKVGHLKGLMARIGFVKLPFTYDIAASRIDSRHSVDRYSLDTLFFTGGQLHGVLPDTSRFYCILYYQPGDSLYPFLATFDKNGNMIDNENIGMGMCRGLLIDIERCVDQVTIREDMTFDLLYKVTGTAEDGNTGKQFKICNTMVGTGRIGEDGKIEVTRSELVDCGNGKATD